MNRFNDSQMSLFATPREKGSSEWGAFSMHGDSTGMFRVRQPQQQSRFSVTTIKRPARPQSLFFKRGTQN